MTNEAPKKLDPVAKHILASLAVLEIGKSLSLPDLARSFAEPKRGPKDPIDLWRRYLPSVTQQALFLARRGDIVILRKGEPQDASKPIKGVWRVTAKIS